MSKKSGAAIEGKRAREDLIKDPISDLSNDDVWLYSSLMLWHFYIKSIHNMDHASVDSTEGRDSLSLNT